MKIERCIRCDDPTGRAGRGDDSLYTDDGNGPFCPDCWGGVRSSELSASVTAPDDPIRRGTAERAIRALIDSPARGSDLHARGVVCGLVIAQESLAALPADPVAEAAGKLAEATEANETASRVMDHDMDAWRAAPVHRRHELGLVADNAIKLKARAERAYHAALHAYRAAVAARAKETR